MEYTETDGEEYDWPKDIVIDGMLFQMTCSACPEQYDVWYNEKQIGYIRLRWGILRAYYPSHMGDKVYEAIIGDGEWQGHFSNEEERIEHLSNIAKVLKNWLDLKAQV